MSRGNCTELPVIPTSTQTSVHSACADRIDLDFRPFRLAVARERREARWCPVEPSTNGVGLMADQASGFSVDRSC